MRLTSDHLGNTTYITDREGNLEQYLSYLPYGEVFIEKSFKDAYATPYKFNGKELDEETGLYYYGARYLHPKYAMWLSTDPQEGKYPNVSSYCYTSGNSVIFNDPSGEEPVYNRKGNFLGTTSEGFTGTILIYDGNKKIDFSSMNYKQFYSNYIDNVYTYDEVKQLTGMELSDEAKSNIWTNIASHFEGENIYDERFSLSSIRGSSIGYENMSKASWQTSYSPNNTIKPQITGSDEFEYEATVENIASSIIVHEWYSHGKKFNGDKMRSHRLAYKNVVNYKPLWNKTTDKYKKFNLIKLRKYTYEETGRDNVDGKYRRLYNKYVKNKML